jgi:uncharacterized membrane protein (GlpM family)
MTTCTTRHYLAGLLAVLATFGGIALYNHAAEQARGHECVARGVDPAQCWGDRR